MLRVVSPHQFAQMQVELLNPLRSATENAEAALMVAGVPRAALELHWWKTTEIVVDFT
jgi:hypothetical protein